MRKITTVLYIVLALSFLQCKKDTSPSQEQKTIKIACTTAMAADLVKNITGAEFEVRHLMGPGVDPHLYKASQGDLQTLQEADMIVYNGLHLEGKMTEIFEKLSKIKKVVALADLVDTSRILMDDAYEGLPDPHIWFNADLWASSLPGLAQEICSLDDSKCENFVSNANSYKQRLDSLHNYAGQELARIDDDRRVLITAHDAFKYFGDAYNIEVRGLQGISTLSEFGLKDRIDLVNFIVENGIGAVFVESSVSQKNILAIVEACKEKGHDVIIGESLYSDAMGEDGTEEGTYIGMFRSNIRNIVNGLSDKENSDNES